MAVSTTHLTGPDPVVRRRRLTQHLVHLRGARTQQSVADGLGWSRAKLIRIENGTTGIAASDLRMLLAHYAVSNPSLVELLVRMARESRHPALSPYADVLSPEMIYYLRFEASASSIRHYHPHLIPGLLQTEEYATAVITALADSCTPDSMIARQVEARLDRQATLDDERVHAHFILDESALRRGMHARGLMSRQLDHILRLTRRDHVIVQVLPFGVGLLRGAQWPFVLLDFDEADSDTLLYLEGRDTRVTRDDPAEIARHRAAFAELAAVAVPVGELSLAD